MYAKVLVLAALAAFVAAQEPACPAPDGSFCEAENIIQTCKDNQSTLGNCNDNLSGSCPGQIAEAKCVKGDGFGNASCVLVDCVGGSS